MAHRTKWIAIDNLNEKMQVTVKIRYNFNEQPAEIVPLGHDMVKVMFKESQKAVTPGQAAVLYKNDTVVGGGIIKQRCHL